MKDFDFIKLMKDRIHKINDDENSLDIPNTKLVSFVNNYVKKHGTKFPDSRFTTLFLSTLVTLGAYPILSSIFGNRKLGTYICHSFDTFSHLRDIYDAYNDWLDLDIDKEIPVLTYSYNSGSEKRMFLLTNLAFHYKLPKSKKRKDMDKLNTGKIPLKDINKVDITHYFGFVAEITINDELIGCIEQKENNFAFNLLHNLFQSFTNKKQSLITQ